MDLSVAEVRRVDSSSAAWWAVALGSVREALVGMTVPTMAESALAKRGPTAGTEGASGAVAGVTFAELGATP
jgi:hypothetical protein